MDTNQCDLCGRELPPSEPWIALCRYVVNSSRGYQFLRPPKGTEVWQPDQAVFRGYVLCFPTCLNHWLEAKLAEIDFVCRRRNQD